MQLDHIMEWFGYSLVIWLAISLLATPWIGRSVAGALSEKLAGERTPMPLPEDARRRTAKPAESIAAAAGARGRTPEAVP